MELVDVCTDNIITSLPVGFGIVDEAVDEDVEEMDTSNKDEEEEEEELSSEDDLKKEIGSTIDYLIEHDKKRVAGECKGTSKG